MWGLDSPRSRPELRESRAAPRRFPARAATPEAYDFLVESWTTDAEEPLAGLVPDLESWLDAHRLVQELRCGPIPVIVDT